ncbi:flagellar hook-basal body complex protein [Antarcticimicrobium luteum]|uniref:Flagellar hook-basal body complex protein n=1 Tax=Antarcticimicrobium luteum TaxID=2547397 RepID=A0A4R5VD13_9RHOB|nr:flagellar hook-basal body complex protein [Antarcticimicrobium luteum]TDK50214.1 flagellar hook-basal body complex protein [Antarcticimicrobium luteum]
MSNADYVSLSLATALQRSMDMSAHNMANATTAGYKSMHPLFEAVQPDGEEDMAVSYVEDRGTYLNSSQGALIATGSPLDLALSGTGWFSYQTGTGATAYGRDGRLTVNSDGQLSTLTGAPILNRGGAPITLPQALGQDITISADGTITEADGGILGQIGIFRVPDVDRLVPIGGGLYLYGDAGGAAVPDDETVIAQGFVEQSNVQPVVEMTRLMDIQRAYERAAKLMSDSNDLTRQAIQRLGRVV